MRSPTTRSLGHLSRGRKPAAASTPSQAARPAAISTTGTSPIGSGGRSSTDTSREVPGSADHDAAQPAPAGGLVVGHEHEPLGRPDPGLLHELRVGRADLVVGPHVAEAGAGQAVVVELAK